MPAAKWLAPIVAVLAFSASSAEAPRSEPKSAPAACASLSGRFVFWGDWKQSEFVDLEQSAQSAFQAAHRKPRFDLFALSFVAQQIVEPQHVELQHDAARGLLVANVIGRGVDTRGIDAPMVLPAHLTTRCLNGAWEIRWQAAGGGENVKSETVRTISLRLAGSGEVIATGQEQVTTGWLLKRRRDHRWQAVFAAMPK